MRYKIIDLNGLGVEDDVVEVFDSEMSAIIYIRGVARALNMAGYKIVYMPRPLGIDYNMPQFLKAVKYQNPDDENSDKETILFALMSVEKDELLVVEKTICESWDNNDVEYEISRKNNIKEFQNEYSKIEKENFDIQIYKNIENQNRLFVIK